VTISSLKLQIDKIEFSGITGDLKLVDLARENNVTMMESVDMEASQITQ
jgi:hypothetical protein